jgi:hypothetical protein
MFWMLVSCVPAPDCRWSERQTFWLDLDGDGHGGEEVLVCPADTEGHVGQGGDCADLNSAVHPAAAEVCDGIDNDCDGDIDGDVDDLELLYADSDGDGFGDLSTAAAACPTAGLVADSTDCDDTSATIWPGAPEVLDGQDSDCDGVIDQTSLSDGVVLSDGGTDRAGDQAGYSVAGPGDVNGDGYDDLLIGANYEDSGGSNAGAAYLILGRDDLTGQGLSDADVLLTGEEAGGEAGQFVGGLGDLDGDGYDDIAVIAPEYGDTDGRLYLLWGGGLSSGSLGDADAIFDAIASADRISGASSGDINDDGFPELIVSAFGAGDGNEGAVYVFEGSTERLEGQRLSSADAILAGERGDSYPGQSMGAADISGDGISDLFIAAPGHNYVVGVQAGAVFFFLGGQSLPSMDITDADHAIYGIAPGDYAGTASTLSGDINGDGTPDLVAAATREDSAGEGAGALYVVSGSDIDITDSFQDATSTVYGEQTGDAAGIQSGLDTVDLNDDGFSDVIIAAAYSDRGGSDAGSVYVLMGSASGLSTTTLTGADAIITGAAAHDYTGWSLASAGDVNQDGHPDLLVGSYGADTDGSASGSATLLLTAFP